MENQTMKIKMEQPELLQIAFRIERRFVPLEAAGDDAINSPEADAAFDEIVRELKEIEARCGREEMYRCAENLQFYMLGVDRHFAERSICFAVESLTE
jgi:hypothetical protein